MPHPANHTHDGANYRVARGDGFDNCIFEGTALITTTAAIIWTITNAKGENAIIPASASDPAWIRACSFRIPEIFSGTNGDRLKVASALADSAVYTALSAVVASTFLQKADVYSTAIPATATEITANTEFKLYLGSGAGGTTAPGGTGLTPVASSSGFLAAPAPTKVRIPIRIHYLKRTRPPYFVDISDAQNKSDLGL